MFYCMNAVRIEKAICVVCSIFVFKSEQIIGRYIKELCTIIYGGFRRL